MNKFNLHSKKYLLVWKSHFCPLFSVQKQKQKTDVRCSAMQFSDKVGDMMLWGIEKTKVELSEIKLNKT